MGGETEVPWWFKRWPCQEHYEKLAKEIEDLKVKHVRLEKEVEELNGKLDLERAERLKEQEVEPGEKLQAREQEVQSNQEEQGKDTPDAKWEEIAKELRHDKEALEREKADLTRRLQEQNGKLQHETAEVCRLKKQELEHGEKVKALDNIVLELKEQIRSKEGVDVDEVRRLQDAVDKFSGLYEQEKLTIGQLEARNAELQVSCTLLHKRVEDLIHESTNALPVVCHSDDEASGSQLEDAAALMELCLNRFSKILLSNASKDEQWKDAQYKEFEQNIGITPGKGDVQCAIEQRIVEVALDGLWELAFGGLCDYWYRSVPFRTPHRLTKQQYFQLYKNLKERTTKAIQMFTDLDVSPGPTGVSRICDQACASAHSCGCGALQFERFCWEKFKALSNLEFAGLKLPTVPQAESPIPKRPFVAFLVEVWNTHLLALALKEPAYVFKVKPGHAFDEDCMVNRPAVELDTEQPCRAKFTIIPGFQVGTNVLKKSLVYVPLDSSS